MRRYTTEEVLDYPIDAVFQVYTLAGEMVMVGLEQAEVRYRVVRINGDARIVTKLYKSSEPLRDALVALGLERDWFDYARIWEKLA